MALTLSTTFFVLSTLAVTPFYLLMLLAPRAAFTRRALGSLWPVALPTLVYGLFLLLILLLLRPDVLGLWRALYVENGLFGATTVAFLSRVYGTFPEYATLHGWVHLVVGDMVMARWAYLDALERATPAWLIALVAFLISVVGPLGLLLYLAVRLRYTGSR